MIKESLIISENEGVKVSVLISVDDKGKPASSTGLLARLTNRYAEGLFEFFNANEIKTPVFVKEVKNGVKK